MDAFNRLQWQIMLDEAHERWQAFTQRIQSLISRHQSRVGVSYTECNPESEGRVWVEAGTHGFRIRVIHLHPANPSVSEALKQRCSDRTEDEIEDDFLKGKLIYPPEDDQISLSSLEDYWFNHWQGPVITADSNHNSFGTSTRLRRSHRKSKRGNRCSMCHKKLVVGPCEASVGEQCPERDENVLAHVPSARIDLKMVKDEPEEKSDDELGSKASIVTEESLSSATEEQLSRMHRVVGNEIRTSLSLFNDEEAVSQDVIDGTICATNQTNISPVPTSALLSPPSIPRQSRSCPCSPKLSTRKLSQQDLASSHSPKSRSFLSISKFSLSNSLVAIHRQASNSLLPDLMKPDSAKAESSGIFKFPSHRGSITSFTRKRRTSAGDQLYRNNSYKTETPFSEDSCEEAANSSIGSSKQGPESSSLPNYKPKSFPMYRHSLKQESNSSNSLEKLAEDETLNSATNHSPTLKHSTQTEESHTDPLPDVVPKITTTIIPSVVEPQVGVINLGFDGREESSDFVEENVPLDDPDPGLSSTARPGLTPSIDVHDEENVKVSANCDKVELPEDARSTGVSCDAPVSSPASTLPVDDLQRPETGTLPSIPSKDLMDEAREQLFWWRRNNVAIDENEFCLHQAECKVKQKPLLMFLHGIGSGADVWSQQLWYFLSCGYEVVAPDLLGHGLSSAPQAMRHYSFEEMLDYVSLVYDLFVPQGRKAILVGHNYGCALAVALTRVKPSSVSLLILLSCGGPSPLVPHARYESGISSTTKLLTPLISCGCLSRELLYAPRGKHYPVVSSDSTGVPATPKYVIDNTSRGQVWPEGDQAFHRRIAIPVLLLYGMKDEDVSFVEMCEMEKTIPRAFLELIPGAGHELMTDCPEETCHAMHRFMRRWRNNF